MSQNILEHLRVIVEINKPEEYNDDFNNNNISMNSTLNNNSTTIPNNCNNNSNNNNNQSFNQFNCNNSWSLSSTMNRRSSFTEQNKRQLQWKRRGSSSNSPPLPTSGGHMKTEIIILDEKTIKLNLRESQVPPYTEVSQKMQFDRVNYIENNDMIRDELDNLMNELIIHKRNCTIMRFTCQHDMSLILFYDRLIDQFDRKLQSTQNNNNNNNINQSYKLQQCHLETQDLATMDECQMSLYNGKCQDHDYESHGQYTMNSRRKNHFRQTGEMLLCLLNEHRLKSQTINGHELLTFTFVINSVDNRNKGQCISLKLHLFNVYCSTMLADERLKWPNFIKNIGRNCCLCSNCNFHYSPLFMKLLPHFEQKATQFGLILFQIPNGNDPLRVQDSIDMLQMAHAMVKYRKPTNRGSLSSLRSFSVESLDGHESAVGGSNPPSLANSMTERRKSIAFTISFDDDAVASPSDTSTVSSFSFFGRRLRRATTVGGRMSTKMPVVDSNNNNNNNHNNNINNKNSSSISQQTHNVSVSGRNRTHNVNTTTTTNNNNSRNNNNNSRNNNNNSRNNSNNNYSNRNVNGRNNAIGNRNNSRAHRHSDPDKEKRTIETENSLYQHHYQNACKWFDKIERCYSNVYRTREIFFKQYFVQNLTVMMRYVGQICTTYLPTPITAQEECNLFPEPFIAETTKRSLQKYYRRYAIASQDFLALPEEILETPYVNTLTAYYEQKQQELNQQETTLKLKYFEQMKKDLCYVVNEEIINVRGDTSREEGELSTEYEEDPSVEENMGDGEYSEYTHYVDGGEVDDDEEVDDGVEVEEVEDDEQEDEEEDEEYDRTGDGEEGGNDGDVFY